MIRWCSYCQKYMDEVPPFEDASFSHGLCNGCLGGNRMFQGDALKRIRPIAEYYSRVAKAVQGEESPTELLDEGLRLGLDPWDLLIGIIQPALHNMGVRWAKGLATVCEEHTLTSTCSQILTLMNARQAGFQALRKAQAPEVLLVNAEDNYHALGIQLVEFFLLTRAVPVLAIHPGLQTQEVVRLVRSVRPRKLGISCALPAQIASARQTAAAIALLPDEQRPSLYVGGFALRSNQEAHPEGLFRVCLVAQDLLDVRR